MRRALVLTTESARHPFRASLPQSSSARAVDDIEPRVPWRLSLGLDAQDLRQFAMTYSACFLATSAFLV